MMSTASLTDRDRLTFAVVAAVCVHAAILFGIRFSADSPAGPTRIIEVTLTRYSEAEAPANADFIAATHQHGSGTAEQVLETTTLQETEFNAPHLSEPVPAPSAPSEVVTQAARAILSTPTRSTESTPEQPEIPTEDILAPLPSGPLNLDSLVREIASLEARIAEEQQAQANRPRIKRLTSVSARSATEAGYLNGWRQRVERVGNANYPRGGATGSLRMLVVVRFDGALEDVRILESSGHKALDDAALRIIRLAAPFPPFPVDMRRHYDQLEIIRTWQFSRTGARLDS
jgi:protein TonB